MKMTNDPPELNNHDPVWYSFADYSLGKDALDEDLEAMLASGSVIQTMKESGLPPECLKRIVRTIREAARNFLHRVPNAPVHIRLFYQRNTAAFLSHSEKRREGGWGFFIIQRGGDHPSVIRNEPYPIIELYIYREGK
jgi:hypothetical protein